MIGWECHCGRTNPPTHAFCPGCAAPRESGVILGGTPRPAEFDLPPPPQAPPPAPPEVAQQTALLQEIADRERKRDLWSGLNSLGNCAGSLGCLILLALALCVFLAAR